MRDSHQYNIGGISSSQKGVDNLVLGAERVSMKAIIPLAVLAMGGSAFAASPFWDSSKSSYENLSSGLTPNVVTITDAPKVETPQVSDDAIYGKGQDFTIVNLPDGKTATAITFH